MPPKKEAKKDKKDAETPECARLPRRPTLVPCVGAV